MRKRIYGILTVVLALSMVFAMISCDNSYDRRPEMVKITFEPDSSQEDAFTPYSTNVEKGKAVKAAVLAEPSALDSTKYIFVEWLYKDDEAPVPADAVFNADTTLVARLTPVTSPPPEEEDDDNDNANLAALWLNDELVENLGTGGDSYNTLTGEAAGSALVLDENVVVTATPSDPEATVMFAKLTGDEELDVADLGYDNVFVFASGDFLAVEVTATDNITKKYYKVEITVAEEVPPEEEVPPKEEIDAQAPVITKHPASAWYHESNIDGILEIAANVTDEGTLSYAWYQAASWTGAGSLITGETGDSLDLSGLILAQGTHYFYAKVTNDNPDATGSVKVNSADSVRARIQIFADGDDVVEQLVLAQNVAIYEFNLPAGAAWSDYNTLTVDYMFDADNLAKDIRFNRVYGNYQAADFTPAGNYMHAPFDAYGIPWIIADNGGAWSPLDTDEYPGLEADTWYTMEYNIDGSTANVGFDQANMPANTATGPFYFGIGISGLKDDAITQLVRNVTLVHSTDTAKNVVSTTSGLAAQAFAGYPQTDSLALSSRIYITAEAAE